MQEMQPLLLEEEREEGHLWRLQVSLLIHVAVWENIHSLERDAESGHKETKSRMLKLGKVSRGLSRQQGSLASQSKGIL